MVVRGLRVVQDGTRRREDRRMNSLIFYWYDIGPLARTFLFTPAHKLSFPASRPHAEAMHRRVTSFPSPVGILPHADRVWSETHTRPFFGHSFTAPTPSMSTLQNLGLCICKSLASHIKYACQKFSDRPPVQNSRRPDPHTVPPLVDHTR